MIIRKLLNAISVVMTVITVILGAYLIFNSFEKLNLYLVPATLSIISLLVASRFLFIIINMVYPIYDFLKSKVKIAVNIISAVIVIICIVFSYNAYTGYVTFHQSSNTGTFSELSEKDKEIEKLFPFSDYFYEIGEKESYYAVSSESTKQCTQIRISNRDFELGEESPSYSVYYFKSTNKTMLLKFFLEEYFYDFRRADFWRVDEKDEFIVTLSDAKIKLYESADGYSAVANNSEYICYIKLSNIDKTKISFDEFATAVIPQTELIDLLSEMKNVPGAQYMYSVKEDK